MLHYVNVALVHIALLMLPYFLLHYFMYYINIALFYVGLLMLDYLT